MNEIKDSTFYCWTPVEELPLKVGESRVVCAEVGAYADVKACAKTLNASTETTPEDKQIEEEITSCMKSKGWLRTEALINY